MDQNNKNIDFEKKDRHEFAFFFENLSETLNKQNINFQNLENAEIVLENQNLLHRLNQNKEIVFESQDLFHRLNNVIRLETGQNFTLFDQNINVTLELISFYNKKRISAKIVFINKNKIILPKINFLLPILKRENLELAIYSCCELGANEITLLETQKSQKNFNIDRATKILVSAAEQSKNFFFSKINLPIDLEKYIKSKKEDEINIFFDSEGEELDGVVKIVKEKLKTINIINLMIGPEGDLTENEKIFLKKNNFVFCKLTPTILRSCQAVGIGLGIFRSIFNK